MANVSPLQTGSSGGGSQPPSLLGALLPPGINMASNVIANVLNANQNQKNMELQKWMFEQQMKYNSPDEQRRMLEKAGYSPAAYLQGSGASPVSGSVPTSIPMSPLQMQDTINPALTQVAERQKMLAEADKASAEAAKTEFDLGLDKDSAIDLLNTRYFDSRKALADATIATIQSNLLQQFGEQETQEKINNLIASTRLLTEQGATESNKRKWYDAYSALMQGRNSREQQQLRYQIALMMATTKELGSRSRLEILQGNYQENYNINYGKFGYSLMESQMIQAFANEDYAKALARKMEADAEKARVESSWAETHELYNCANFVKGFMNDAAHIRSMNKSAAQKDEMINQRWQEIRNQMTDRERTIVDRYYNMDGKQTGVHTRSYAPLSPAEEIEIP